MIIVDENLSDALIVNAIAKGYSGQVRMIMDLRPRSIIKDDAISTLLLKSDQPTFVTINVSDFWKKAKSHSDYCIVCISVPQDRAIDSLELVRPFLRSTLLRPKPRGWSKCFTCSHRISSIMRQIKRFREPLGLNKNYFAPWRNTLPVRSPVKTPSFTATTPFTITCLIPCAV